MSGAPVTVAIPVLNAGAGLAETLQAVRAQVVDRPVELLVCDSGSDDGTVTLARRLGAEVFEIPRGTFSHGGTRNLLMERAGGEHVAFLTQDAVPAGSTWLARLLAGFDLAGDVALVHGPYLPRPGASHMVARELTEWFASLAPDGQPRIDRLARAARLDIAPELLGPAGFFTDANGCVARAAWADVPFRPVPYAEDRLLALDMLRAGYAKVFAPDAAVIHSHDYRPLAWFRRCFDEWRGLAEVYGHVEPAGPRRTLRSVRGGLGADWRWLRRQGVSGGRAVPAMARSLLHHTLRAAGAALGSRAGALPPRARRWCSLERRSTFLPQPTAPPAATIPQTPETERTR